jgi:hypothetical protein
MAGMLLVRKKLLVEMAVLVVTLTIVQYLAIGFFLYVRFWWLDILMHAIGGAFVGLLAIWFFYFSGYISNENQARLKFAYIAVAFFTTLIFALLWEVYEFIILYKPLIGSYLTFESYFQDTVKDVVVGLLGSLLAVGYFFITKLHLIR